MGEGGADGCHMSHKGCLHQGGWGEQICSAPGPLGPHRPLCSVGEEEGGGVRGPGREAPAPSFISAVSFTIRFIADAEMQMSSVERIAHFTTLEPRTPRDGPKEGPKGWGVCGRGRSGGRRGFIWFSPHTTLTRWGEPARAGSVPTYFQFLDGTGTRSPPGLSRLQEGGRGVVGVVGGVARRPTAFRGEAASQNDTYMPGSVREGLTSRKPKII